MSGICGGMADKILLQFFCLEMQDFCGKLYQCQYIADIRYQCSAVLGCRDRLGGDRDCVGGDRDCLGSGPGPCRVGSGTVPGGRGWRDGVAVLGSTVSVRPGTVTVWPGSVTEGVPRRGYRGPSKTTSTVHATHILHI